MVMLRYVTIVESKLIVWLLHKSEYKNSHELTALDICTIAVGRFMIENITMDRINNSCHKEC